MNTRLSSASRLYLACFALSGTALAAEPGRLSPHVVDAIRLTVRSGDAMILATVVAVPSDRANTKAKFKVDQTLMGAPLSDVELPLDGFFPGDLKPGTQWLIPLKQVEAGWACAGRYELVVAGRIHDVPQERYINRTLQEVALSLAERKQRKAPAVAETGKPSRPKSQETSAPQTPAVTLGP